MNKATKRNQVRDKRSGTKKYSHPGKRNKNKIKKANQRTFVFFFAGALILLPVVFFPLALDYTLMPRITALSILLTITLAAILKKRQPAFDFSVLRQWLFPILGLYLLINILTSFFANNHQETFFHLVKTLLFVTATAVASLLMLNTPDWKERVSKMATLGVIIPLIVGIVQYINYVVLSDQALLQDGRIVEYSVVSLMSHKNIFSVFLMMTLPFAVFGIFRFNGKWKNLAAAVSMVSLIMILLLKTRSAWLAIIAATFVVSMLIIFFSNQLHVQKAWRNRLAILIIAVAASLVTLFLMGRTADPFSVPGRLYSIIDTESPHNIHRISIWKGTAQMIPENPVTGIGPGNWRMEAPKYYEQRFDQPEALNWARPHNDFLWVATEKGLGGLILYMGIFIVSVLYLFRIIKSKTEGQKPHDQIFALCLLAGLVAYLVDANFSFPYERIEIQVMLSLLIASAVTMHHQRSSKPAKTNPPKALFYVAIVLLGFGVAYGYSATRKEVHAAYAIKYHGLQDFDKMLAHAKKSRTPFRSLDAMGYPAEYFIGYAQHEKGNFQQALDDLEKALQQTPNNAWVLMKHAQTLQQLGHFNQSEQSLKKILDMLPKNHTTLYHLANSYFAQGKYVEAYEALTSIENWEDHPNIVNNVRILETRMEENPQ